VVAQRAALSLAATRARSEMQSDISQRRRSWACFDLVALSRKNSASGINISTALAAAARRIWRRAWHRRRK